MYYVLYLYLARSRVRQELRGLWRSALTAAEAPLEQLLSAASDGDEPLALLGPLRRLLVEQRLPESNRVWRLGSELRKALEAQRSGRVDGS